MSVEGPVPIHDDLPTVLLQRAPDVIAQQIERETLLFVPSTSSLLVLDDLATYVWEMLALPIELTDLCQRLAADFRVSIGVVAKDMVVPYEVLVEGGAVRAIVTSAAS